MYSLNEIVRLNDETTAAALGISVEELVQQDGELSIVPAAEVEVSQHQDATVIQFPIDRRVRTITFPPCESSYSPRDSSEV